MTIQLRYFSMTGNTRAFINRLESLSHEPIHAVEIDDSTPLFDETEPYYVLVPTYLSGGTGIGPDVTEIMTTAIYDHITDGNNLLYLKGVIGSGNLNFNEQFALTAKRYSKEFGVPLIMTYELQGTNNDAVELLTKIGAHNGN